MSAHTPGPWSIETVPTSCGICHKVGPFPGKRPDGKPRHACLYADYPSKSNPADDELAANARLIAAAPDLLESLILMVRTHDEPAETLLQETREQQWIAKARAAIAKATGEQA